MTITQSIRRMSAAVFALIMTAGLLVAAATPAQAITAESIVTRAQSWVDAHVPYSQTKSYTNQYGTYRTDCSGFVSMAWGLGQSLTTVTLPSVSHVISKDELQPGDVLLNTNPGNSGHVILFAGWSNAAHTAYNGYESSPAYDGAHFTSNVPYPYWAGYGTFTPYRYNNYETTPADRDHDGIPDASDRCPDQPGSAATGGCPDTDGDAVADLDDKCPQMPGLAELTGCSEEDINPMPGPAADFNGDGKADYCRRVGADNGVQSHIACTLSTGDGFGKTVMSPVIDWGYDTGRAWVDFNGDNKADYCRRVGADNGVQSHIACTLSTGDGFGNTVMSPVIDWGYDTGRAWVGASLRYPRAQEGTSPPPATDPGTPPQTSRKLHRPRKITVKRISRTHVLVRWKPVAGAARYRIRLSSPHALRTAWRSVKLPRARIHLRKGRHAVVTIRATGQNRVGPAGSRRL